MHIAFDGMIWGGAETGVSLATRRLAQCLVRLILKQSGHDVTEFVPRDLDTTSAETPSGGRHCIVRCDRRRRMSRVCWQQFVLPILARRHHVDLLYCPCYTVPMLSKIPCVVTVHDLIAWIRPDMCRVTNRAHFRLLVGPSIRKARHITVPTNTVKFDLLSRFPDVPEEKVHVVPWGVDMEIEPMNRMTATQTVSELFGITQPFLLFVGMLEPKKNVRTIIEAAKKIGFLLVVAGGRGWGRKDFHAVMRGQASGHCRYVGYVTQSGLSALYSAAAAFVFPSHVEGFGLPVMEALACGTPVVTSDAPALKEICAGAAIHVPVQDVSALAQMLREVVEDSELRCELIRRGRKRAQQFTWERSGRLFLEILENATL